MLKHRFNVKVLVMPLMVRVSSLVHVWQVHISKLNTILPLPAVSYLKMALGAKQDAVAERIRAFIFSRFPVMRLPAPVCAFGSVSFAKSFTTSPTNSALPNPSVFYSVGRKHPSTSRVEIANPRVKNGWVRNEDMWVLVRGGKSYNVAIMRTPSGYLIFKGSKTIGTSRTLEAAKRRAEKIKTPRQPYK